MNQPDAPEAKHDAAVRWVNDLVLDLKLQLHARKPHGAITEERLNEWNLLYRPKLERCH